MAKHEKSNRHRQTKLYRRQQQHMFGFSADSLSCSAGGAVWIPLFRSHWQRAAAKIVSKAENAPADFRGRATLESSVDARKIARMKASQEEAPDSVREVRRAVP
ncbi:hypothetical protein BIW11_06151 [Tropilaelaps mercedesae]|uniref:Uncharacterized protein n=1 Tax=Tropilaelaps mercedesae TaxID=418985 RepID=A0A1V9XZA2_9ACAR|nr:hypothetical protein BIW11_06151 [Tropilaelaps mercedesae]